ncbi:MAG: thiamine pyrophosphate-dependent enzyme [Candidatus Caenarcaniphilales bacterium]|nr:thiamine pyrophosphate-dependent enzyme [Candidatus Caenarcaniphilales bacterium]
MSQTISTEFGNNKYKTKTYKLMSGKTSTVKSRARTISQLIANQLKELGVEVTTYVPGHGANEIFISCNQLLHQDLHISFNEEVAYTIAHGSSLAGKRATCIIKTHGFEKAANSIIHSLYSGTTAGFVTLLLDDPDGHHSDNILDIEPLLKGSQVPYIKTSPGTITEDITSAYQLSEEKQLPYFLLIDSREIDKQTEQTVSSLAQTQNKYSRDPYKHIVCPFTAEHLYKVMHSKLNNCEWQKIIPQKTSLGSIKLNQLQKNYIEKYSVFFDEFKNLKEVFVTGDASTASMFALEPYNCIDVVTYLGCSIPLAVGSYLAGNKNSWSLTGDFAFISAGHLGLIEAFQRNIPIKVVIFNNCKAGATGGQDIPNQLLSVVLAGYKEYIRVIENPLDKELITKTINEVNRSDKMEILVLNYEV